MLKNNSKGFSLLEILIAFTILAISLTIVLRIFSAGVLQSAVAEEYTIAVQIAKSLLNKTGVETPLQSKQISGLEQDKYHWILSVQPYVFYPEPVDASAAHSALFKVKALVSWENRQIELVSLKLAAKP